MDSVFVDPKTGRVYTRQQATSGEAPQDLIQLPSQDGKTPLPNRSNAEKILEYIKRNPGGNNFQLLNLVGTMTSDDSRMGDQERKMIAERVESARNGLVINPEQSREASGGNKGGMNNVSAQGNKRLQEVNNVRSAANAVTGPLRGINAGRNAEKAASAAGAALGTGQGEGGGLADNSGNAPKGPLPTSQNQGGFGEEFRNHDFSNFIDPAAQEMYDLSEGAGQQRFLTGLLNARGYDEGSLYESVLQDDIKNAGILGLTIGGGLDDTGLSAGHAFGAAEDFIGGLSNKDAQGNYSYLDPMSLISSGASQIGRQSDLSSLDEASMLTEMMTSASDYMNPWHKRMFQSSLGRAGQQWERQQLEGVSDPATANMSFQEELRKRGLLGGR